MAISEKNLKLINDIESQLKDQLIWVARDAVNQTSSTIGDYKNLRQFTIGLSVALIGIVFPVLIANKIFENNAYFITSLICFSLVVVYGLCHLILSTMNDLVNMPSVIQNNLKELQKCIKEVQRIKKIENNNEAGKEYETLKAKYSEEFPHEKLSFLQKIWRRYEGLIFFGLFIVGYIFLVFGFFR